VACRQGVAVPNRRLPEQERGNERRRIALLLPNQKNEREDTKRQQAQHQREDAVQRSGAFERVVDVVAAQVLQELPADGCGDHAGQQPAPAQVDRREHFEGGHEEDQVGDAGHGDAEDERVAGHPQTLQRAWRFHKGWYCKQRGVNIGWEGAGHALSSHERRPRRPRRIRALAARASGSGSGRFCVRAG